MIGIALTVVATVIVVGDQRRQHVAALDRLGRDTRRAIELRVTGASEALFALRARFMAGQPAVDRAGFRRLVRLSQVFDRNPEITAISFNRVVTPAHVAAFERAVARDESLTPGGYPAFEIHPSPGRTAAVVVDYIEPFDDNDAAFGFDVMSEPTRREGVEQARDSGAAIATAPIPLLQEASNSTGFLMMVAVYDRGELPVTSPARRRSFFGLVVSVFEVEELVAATVGANVIELLTIEDAGAILEPFARERTSIFGEPPSGRSGSTDVNVADRRWRITVSDPDGSLAPSGLAPWGVGAGGLAATLVAVHAILSVARRRHVADLEATAARLRELDRMKTAFLSTVSHELRTPLTAIAGFTALLRREPERLPTPDILTMIARNASSLDMLIDELIQFSRLERRTLSVTLLPIDASVHTTMILDQLAPLLSDHLVVRRVDEGVMVLADVEAVRRVVTNLLTNAVKFSPDGSTITVTVTCRADGGVIDVSDEGPGVPEHERELIFEPFYRGERTGPAAPGTGIGLAVVAELVRLMHGSLEVDDAPGGGSVFRVWLPGPVH